MDAEKDFCINCGAILSEDDYYCKDCGYFTSNEYTDSEYEETKKFLNDERTRLVILILTLAFGVLAVIIGLGEIFGGVGLATALKEWVVSSGFAWEDFLNYMGMSEQNVVDFIVGSGYSTFGSGFFSLVVFALLFFRRYWIMSLIFNLLAAFAMYARLAYTPDTGMMFMLTFTTISFAIGVVITFFLYRINESFLD